MNRPHSGCRYGICTFALLICAALVHVAAASAAHSAQANVKITRSEVRPWDPAVHQRVIEDMADGKPGKGLQPPALLTRRVPKYPKEARKAGIQGSVSVEVKIGLKGKVEQFTVATGHPELVEAVKEAVSQWRFTPMKIDGTPCELKAYVDVAFTLR